VSTNLTRVFVARLLGLDVFDPLGDRLGRLRDVVVLSRGTRGAPHVVGIVVEVPGKKRVFVPMTRITSIDQTQIICTGLVNLRRFEQRGAETLVVAEMFDRRVTLADGSGDATIEDIAMDRHRSGDWFVSKLFVRRGHSLSPLSRLRRNETMIIDWADARQGARTEPQAATQFVATHEDLKPADFAEALQEMSDKRRFEVASELQDERLADVLQEMPEGDQVEILSALDVERAADVLEEMDPDDAADLLNELPDAERERLILLMEPGEAAPIRRLLRYSDDTAGGLMTSEPIILSPDATIAEALARVRNPDVSPALATQVYVCRPPSQTPTGRYLGVAHVQRLLREPPSALVSGVVDDDLEPLRPETELSQLTRYLATYDLVAAAVVDETDRLVGAVTVDDVLDHLLPEDWRERDVDG
jgi:flagellar motility protein MotE (MotC chaperone)/sporulation protein YlmC with PRC-barrel domain